MSAGSFFDRSFRLLSLQIGCFLTCPSRFQVIDWTRENHKYGELKVTWLGDCSSCTATFICVTEMISRLWNVIVTLKDYGDGTVSYTAVVEFKRKSYAAQ